MIRCLSRRAFLSSLAALAASPAIVLKPQVAYAQQPASPRRIGVLLVGFSTESKEAQQFRQGLQASTRFAASSPKLNSFFIAG